MKVFILLDELFAFVHVLGFEKNVELASQFFHNSLDSGLDLFACWQIAVFNLFLQLEHVHHKPTVVNLGLLFDVHASQFHQLNCSF
jgi:hypothetical protein